MIKRRSPGQALVEFALVLPVLLVILMGLFDFGRAVYAYTTVSNAAREALRVAIVDQNTTKIVAEGKQAAMGLPPNTVNVVFGTPGCAGALLIGCTAQVTVNHQWQAITPIVGQIVGPITLSTTTEMPIERVYVSP
jgi:Flp pilus assembly protein TadG